MESYKMQQEDGYTDRDASGEEDAEYMPNPHEHDLSSLHLALDPSLTTSRIDQPECLDIYQDIVVDDSPFRDSEAAAFSHHYEQDFAFGHSRGGSAHSAHPGNDLYINPYLQGPPNPPFQEWDRHHDLQDVSLLSVLPIPEHANGFLQGTNHHVRGSQPEASSSKIKRGSGSVLKKASGSLTKQKRTAKDSSTNGRSSGIKNRKEESGPKARAVRDPYCSFCGGTEDANKDGRGEPMLSCWTCGRSGHPTCLKMTPILEANARAYPWQCIECKDCTSCGVKGDDSKLLFCDQCDQGTHSYCLDPPLSKPPRGEWVCPKCKTGDMPSGKPRRPKQDSSTNGVSTSTRGHPANDRTLNTVKWKGKGKDKGRNLEGTQNGDLILESIELQSGRRKNTQVFLEQHHIIKIKIPTLVSRQASTSQLSKKRKRSATINLHDGSDTEDSQEGLQLPFAGVIVGTDADTSATQIANADIDIFEQSRMAAEIKLGAYADSRRGRAETTPTPSELDGTYDGAASYSPVSPRMPSVRALRDRVLLRTSSPDTPSRGLASTIATTPIDSKSLSETSGLAEKISVIRFGKYDIDTWYSAPYPEEYSRVPSGRLWLCEFCLKYMKSGFVAERHQMKCRMRCPPGDEIYRDNAISVFEVDGRKNKIYCQNLCLLAKMFLDHKTLYYDVEPFLFYVMAEVDDGGARFVGYFSKEKRSPDYNVSCIMTLPVRQRRGWGNLLIDFSYLLSKKESRTGSPEKPLSGLGALSYRTYWKTAVFHFLADASPPVTLSDISVATSMTLEDILTTLVTNDMITIRDDPIALMAKRKKAQMEQSEKTGLARQAVSRLTQTGGHTNIVVMPEDYTIVWSKSIVRDYLHNQTQKGYLQLKPDKLKYTPFLIQRLVLSRNGMLEKHAISKAQAVEIQGREPDFPASEEITSTTISDNIPDETLKGPIERGTDPIHGA